MKRRSRGRLIRSVVTLALCAIVMIYSMRVGIRKHTRIEYMDHLDDVVLTIDGEELTLKELLFYVAYQENKVEHDARIYNPENSRDYWNIHTNGAFVKEEAKTAVLGMAEHDHIFFKIARDQNVVLTSDEKQDRDYTRMDFWSDLYPEQREILEPYSEEIDQAIDRIALAEKAQMQMAEKDEVSFAAYNWAAYEYENTIKSSHDIKLNERLWERVILGDNTIYHDKVSYTPFKNSEEEKDEDREK